MCHRTDVLLLSKVEADDHNDFAARNDLQFPSVHTLDTL